MRPNVLQCRHLLSVGEQILSGLDDSHRALDLRAQAAFPTCGEFVAYLLTGHLGYHLGQLAAWRAAAGLGPLSRSDTLAV